ncbi:hypothetical protein B1H58_04110 [Pantoea alhagi]|uniref:Uncharacterized protein n=1 Tax=Pantoea alhagi TaxID=1891675 RepID=A0A1W6B2F6_9GAMM|nr:hypothetical protein B1H58_04110 [Pantoea alhagi]
MIIIAIKYISFYSLQFISFMFLFSVLGYYVFVFDWGGNMTWSAINAIILLMASSFSIAIYYLVGKLKLVL